MTPRALAAGRQVLSRARSHPGLALALALAGALRAAIDRGAAPAVYQDSLVYLRAAPHAPLAPYSPTRPSGYPLVLRMLGHLPGAQLDTVTAVQHLTGLGVGVLVYLIVTAAGGRRWLAVVAAALVLAEAFTIALEQSILAETTFTALLAASGALTLSPSRSGWPRVAGGLLLGAACTVRSVGVFAVPVWAAWVILAKPGPRVVAGAMAAVAAPVLGYATVHAAQGAGFSLQGSDGWFLYAKVGPIASCDAVAVEREALALCDRPEDAAQRSFEFFLYEGASPAYRAFHGGTAVYLEDAVTPQNNRVLRRFSLDVIEGRPRAFLGLVGREVLRYLGPWTAPTELSLYGRPGTALAAFERWFHLRWWMVTGPLVAGGALAMVGRRARELGLLVGLPAALIVGAAATSGFNGRYLLPAVPLLAAAGALVAEEALRWQRPPGAGSRGGGGSSPVA